MSVESYSNPYDSGLEDELPYGSESQEDLNFEQRAIEDIREIVQNDEVRAKERYKGKLFGKAREFLNREGERSEVETLEEVGEWKKNPKWKKWARIGAKVAGGAGVAAAMVFTGGIGSVLTPLLFSGALREAVDGTLEAVEELGWGTARTNVELEAQAAQSEIIHYIKERVSAGDLTEEEYNNLIQRLLRTENDVTSVQKTNMGSERKGALIRSLASSVITLGTGIYNGVPLGHHNYDATVETAKGLAHSSHNVMWDGLNGSTFSYNPGESANAARIADSIHAPLNTFANGWGQTSHVLGHGLPIMEKVGLAAAGVYTVGKSAVDFVANRREKEGFSVPDYPAYSTYGSSYTSMNRQPDRGSGPYGTEVAETAPINPEQEIGDEHEAIDKYVESWPKEYKGHMNALQTGLEKQGGGMKEECRVAVCIPVAYNEQNIIKTLEMYKDQVDPETGDPLSSDKFEVILFVNGPKSELSQIQKIHEEVRVFQEANNFPVRIFSKTFPGNERIPIGEIRKSASDVALLRSRDRSKESGPLTIVSNDADPDYIPKDYVNSVISTFDKDSSLRMAAGKVDYKSEDLKATPYLLGARRLWQFTDIIQRYGKYGGTIPKALGANSAIRASSYAKVGGFDKNSRVAEDLLLGKAVSKSMGKNALQYESSIYLQTSPRRDLDAISKGMPLIQMYNNNRFEDNDDIRSSLKVDNIADLTTDSPKFIERLNLDCSAMLNQLYDQFFWPKFDKHPEVIKSRRENPGKNLDQLVFSLKKGQLGTDALQDALKIFNKATDCWGAETTQSAREGIHTKGPDKGKSFLYIDVKIKEWKKLKEGIENYEG